MADISSITLPDGTVVYLKDSEARAMLSKHLELKVVDTLPEASADTLNAMYLVPEASGGEDTKAEYITLSSKASDGSVSYKWEKIGSTGVVLKGYSKTGHTHAYTRVTGVPAHSYTPSGTIGAQTFTGSEADVSVSGTPEGTVSKPAIAVTPTTATKYVASSAAAGGAVTAGSAASCTLPKLTMSVSGESLVIGWSGGSFTANSPTKVTLPSFAAQTIVTGVSAALAATPAFTGKPMTSTGKLTPSGSISKAVFTGAAATLAHSLTTGGATTGVNNQ
ncbi:MAG: hypothetical protein MR519_10725 [Spirochaetaceae bacterium]|nr:hypothetical protein [Spirochaetaceae bacterium]